MAQIDYGGQRMTFDEYQKQAQRTSNTVSIHDAIINGVMGLCGEAGECVELVKKWQFQGHELDKDRLESELGDVLWYCAELARGLNISLEHAATANIEKLWRRFPTGFDSVRSTNRGN